MLRTEILKGYGPLEELRPQWSELLLACPEATVFQSPEWLLAWGRTFRRSLVTFAIHEGSDLVGLYPMVLSRRGWTQLRPMGVGPSDYLGPMVLQRTKPSPQFPLVTDPLPRGEGDIYEALADALSQYPVDLLDLQQIRETNPILTHFQQIEPKVQAKCCVLDLPKTFDEYVKGLSKSLRYEVRRPNREPYVSGRAVIRTASTPAEALEFFRVFSHLHEQRWKTRKQPGAFLLPKLKAFHQLWLAGAIQHDRVRLQTLWLDGNPIGALYVMKLNASYYFYQSGFDPEQTAHSPGTVLVSETIRMAIEEGMTTFDFLRGDEPYKLRWKPQRTLSNVRVLKKCSPLAGSVGEWANGMGYRMEQGIRKRLEGKGLF